jgi:pimeloyl-ACP methyl ester carboxylesterase
VLFQLTTASTVDYYQQLAGLLRNPICYGREVKHGSGQPVLLIPGFFAGDWIMAPMARWLKRIGYEPYLSGIDLNLGCPREKLERLEARVKGIVNEGHGRVAIIGHSLGGVMARSIGIGIPEYVSHVIGLGAPISNDWESINHEVRPLMQSVAGLWQRIAGAPPECGTAQCKCGFARILEMATRDSRAFTSIYTREDEVLDWRTCLDQGGRNCEVGGRHIGLIVNREVYSLIAGVLSDALNPKSAVAVQSA